MRKTWLPAVILAAFLGAALFAHALHNHPHTNIDASHDTHANGHAWGGMSSGRVTEHASNLPCAACAFLKSLQTSGTAPEQSIVHDDETPLRAPAPRAIHFPLLPFAFHSRAPPAATA